MSSVQAPTRTRKKQNQTSAKSLWSPEEDDLLKRLVESSSGVSWTAIAKHFPNKTAAQLSGRWDKVINPSLIKGSWTKEEDEQIVSFVQTHGDRDWSKLATILKGRTGKQCRERFRNHLDPTLIKTPWTPEEDEMLIDLHKKFGNAWTTISACMKGRPDNMIKNRWNSIVRKNSEKKPKEEPSSPKKQKKAEVMIPLSENPVRCVSPISMPPTPELKPIVGHLTLNLPFRLSNGDDQLCSLEQNRSLLNKLLNE